jgi:hypothetical protein
MRITCSCGKKLQVNDALAGKRVKCPGCGEAILAREDGVPQSAPAPARPTRPAFSEEDEDSPRPRSRRRDEEEDEDRPRRPRLREDDADDERPAAKGVSVLGIVSLVLGILGALISLFPCIGWVVGIPLAGIGLILGVIGLVVAMKGKQSGPALPIAGTAVSVLGLIIAGAWLVWIGMASRQVGQQVQQGLAQMEAEQAKMEQEKQQIRQGPAIDVTAAALAKEYSANSIAADQKYKGKVLAVKGRVERVDDFGFAATLHLKTDGPGETVDCEFEAAEKNALVALKPGTQVTVRGKCKGKFGFSPGLEKCVLVN